MTQTLQSEAAVARFSDIQIDDLGLGYRYTRAGTGASVLILVDDQDVEEMRFHTLLAERFAVTLVNACGVKPSEANLAAVIASLDAGGVVLMCSGKAAAVGLGCALASPALVSKLILIAPELTEIENFTPVATPVLVMEGSVDRTEADDVGQRLAGSLPACYDILVYDATRSLAVERPEAAASVVTDFIERGGGFTVTKPQGPLYP